MDRKLIVVAVCALAALSAAASAAFGQEQKKAVPKLHIMHATKAVDAETGEAVKNEVAATGASKKSGLPLFTYTIQSDRDGQQYTGVIVGADPTSKSGNKSTNLQTFIVPVIVGDDRRAVAAAEHLQAAGWDVRAIRPPSVPAGTARLRISIHADHDPASLIALARAVAEVVTPALAGVP